ncbi:LOW QUALITY PROTEIN: uncharacterized protein EMH_0073560 [Eimeria mitis]|uniref:Uncharacterized protein n=1 Tax=Eimeria mitis TaxID=44415 RepID=U6KHK2_9EIME|nr:LOW QUALITY PROTEIN: uncharacterized protein EMH_0073560 [Eimeria mitis]CDJ36271.1 hypothetical protein EMH_0073560 [Eimeria mitis]
MMETLDHMDALVLVEHLQELAVLSANIGQQFLALDAIVSAMHVLGQQPSSCSWWEAFANCFDTSFRYPEPISRSQESARVNIDLANRMLAAMSIYKTGNRPQFEEIIDLKRILFFSRYAPLYFRSFKWKAWRDDYLMFEKEHPSFSEWLQKRRHLPK